MVVTSRTVTRNAVSDYAESVINGDVITGRLVRLACERHLDDIEHGALRGLRFDVDAAERAFRFFHGLCHSKGEWAGQPFDLEPWQKFIVGSVYGWKRADGTRRFRIVYNELGRKNGKTQLVAGAALYTTFADGEAGAEGYIAATKRDQARICWDEAARMVRATPALRNAITVLDTRGNLSNRATNSKLEPLARDADSLDGLNPHFAGVDELHAHPTREMVDVLETAVGSRRQPLIWYITTAGFNLASVWGEKRGYAINVLDGVIDDDSLFVYIATIDRGDDWRDETVWIKSNPNLGISVKLDTLREECRKAQSMPGQQNAFRAKRINEPVEQASRLIDMNKWDASDGTPEYADGDVCYVGLDLSTTTDLTAGILVFPRADGSVDLRCHFWLPEIGLLEKERRDNAPYRVWAQQGYLTTTEGDIVDYDVIRETIRDESLRYELREIAYDKWNATQLATQLMSDGATVVPVSQGYSTLSEPTKHLMGLVLAGKVRHGGNPILRWMAANVAAKDGPNDAIRPVKGNPTARVDGIVALIMALSRSMVHSDDTSSVGFWDIEDDDGVYDES